MAWVGNDEQLLLESEDEKSDGSVRPLEDSDDKSEDGTDFLDLANFQVPDAPSSEVAVVKRGVRRGARRGVRRGVRIQRRISLMLRGRLDGSNKGQPS